MAQQLKYQAIPIFNILHPDSTAIFYFDNSSNHQTFAPDALLIRNLNVSDGGARARLEAPMRNTTWIDQEGTVHEQSMQTNEGVQKGLRTILTERGVATNGMKKDDMMTSMVKYVG